MNARQLFLSHVAQTSPSPVMIEVARAEGAFIHGTDGKAYIDMISGIGVANVGHSAPEVVEAVQEQAASYMHTMVYGEHVQAQQVMYARALAQWLGEQLDVVYFTNSGAEAVEGALKLAKKFTGRGKIVAFESSYHGSTHGALSVTGGDWLKEGYGPMLPNVHHIRFNSFEDLAHIDAQTACVITELVRAEAGVELPVKGYLEALSQRCKEVGCLLIVDEIQTAFGRTGHMFAHQAFEIKPDILLLAKSLGGGMPLGAFISRREIMQVISHDPVLGHITTFGGHPVSCAAGLAALMKIEGDQLLFNLNPKVAIIEGLRKEKNIKAVRGMGMMWALQLENFDQVNAVCQACLTNGVIVDWFLFNESAVRLAPPLVISDEDLKEAVEIIRQAVRKLG